MSRPLRIEYPGAWYHVMNRGRRKEEIFLTRGDYDNFIKILQEASENWHIKISAYCLMPNHYHLLVNTPKGNISRCMRHINGIYTQRFNRQHKTDGQLFRGRYKAVLVEADSHLLEVLRYIHRNPLRAGLVEEMDEVTWSSHHGYLSAAKKWAWLDKDVLLTMLCAKKSGRRAAYEDFVSKDTSEEIERFYSLKNLPSVLGGDAFKDWLKEKFQHLCFHEEIPESRILAPTAEEIIREVCDHFQVEREQLTVTRRGRENLPRDMAVYLVRLLGHSTLNEVGKYFGMKNYSTVSSAVERLKSRMKKDRMVRKHLDEVREKLKKGQK
ncbi:transposase [Desulfobulbus alkaliphilus]|uniref:transposase n=1 Tax=Desulfobulbus alkaliphilus TaxID=869814 RepID=UPI00196293FD|nr:transposase [Desulfobulbus alkaliphilus]MBM9537547.1 transposase [Desulfobulbus alkaliphilus]